jgi:hypothetical protein
VSPIGYVVVTWNQASYEPEIDPAGLYDTIEAAKHDVARLAAYTAKVGRRERHTIAQVVELDEEDTP